MLLLLTEGGISEEEFIKLRKTEFSKQFDAEMSDEDVEAAKLRFKLIDSDKSGSIDWDEYLNFECMKKLSDRPAVNNSFNFLISEKINNNC